jgi:NAD(P)-dependent dehydrogenase (short-subunit alcohol dehydrogenase family)
MIRGSGGHAVACPADVMDRVAIERLVAQVERLLGSVDLLVNSAGAPASAGPVWESDPDGWWHCIDVNLRGPFLCSCALPPGMVARRRGRVITVARRGGLKPWAHASGYAAGKTGVIRLCETLALEVGEHGASIFAIQPGGVHTAVW